jgi:DNA-directed RNA polymerase sigma subunit (sigma70/sigma32)
MIKKIKSQKSTSKDVAYFENLDSVVVAFDYDENLTHPAEIAARFQSQDNSSGSHENSDEQILKDLRREVFSVPLLRQNEIGKLFNDLDNTIFPLVHKLLEISDVYFEGVLQTVTKVAAGNTYGKNIYEKESELVKSTYKTTYKDHELDFLKNSYLLLKTFTKLPEDPKLKSYDRVAQIMKQCKFIRGVYEEILQAFVEQTKNYTSLHWAALNAKINQDQDLYQKTTTLIHEVDTALKTNHHSYYVAREASSVYKKYLEIRSLIMAPYLRSVYSSAKNAAKNAHQTLDNFQNGSLGLIRAISCYSLNRSTSFAALAKWWIKQTMLLSIKEGANFVKLPVSTWQAYAQLEKIKNKKGINEDDLEGLAKEAGIPVKKVKAVYETVKVAQVYSLNKAYDNDDKLTLEDILSHDPEEDCNDLLTTLCDYCQNANLTDNETKALALKFGMVDIIRPKPVPKDKILEETLLQNLAAIGFHFKLHSTL